MWTGFAQSNKAGQTQHGKNGGTTFVSVPVAAFAGCFAKTIAMFRRFDS